MACPNSSLLAQSEYKREEKVQNICDMRSCYEEILRKKECVSLKDLAVTGSDLLADGMQPGKEIGQVLSALLEIVMEHPEWNQREILLKKAGGCRPSSESDPARGESPEGKQ